MTSLVSKSTSSIKLEELYSTSKIPIGLCLDIFDLKLVYSYVVGSLFVDYHVQHFFDLSVSARVDCKLFHSTVHYMTVHDLLGE